MKKNYMLYLEIKNIEELKKMGRKNISDTINQLIEQFIERVRIEQEDKEILEANLTPVVMVSCTCGAHYSDVLKNCPACDKLRDGVNSNA